MWRQKWYRRQQVFFCPVSKNLLKGSKLTLETLIWFLWTVGLWNLFISSKIYQSIKIFFSVHITYESLLFNASKNNLNKTFEFVLLCLSFRPWAGSHVKQFFCWINCFIFSSLDSDYIGSSESDDDGKQLNTIDTQHKQYNHNSLDFQNFKSENYVKIFPWLYYQSVEKGYKCRTCELLPSVGSGW